MPQHYITNDETIITEQIGGRYDLRHKDDYVLFVPTLASTLSSAYGYDEAIALVDRVIRSVRKRASESRANYKVYELESFAKLLCLVRGQIETRQHTYEAREQHRSASQASSILGRMQSLFKKQAG